MSKHVMVFGTFDLLHPGHLFLIREAQKLGHVTVVVARAKNVEKIKGRTPVEDDTTRIAAIQKEFPDATVILGSKTDFLEPIRTHKPDLLLLGYDQRLPPTVDEALLPPIQRAEALRPDIYKSSLMKKGGKKGV